MKIPTAKIHNTNTTTPTPMAAIWPTLRPAVAGEEIVGGSVAGLEVASVIDIANVVDSI